MATEKDSVYFSHTNKKGNNEPLYEHLILVAKRAQEYAAEFNASMEAYMAGMLHDIGKYGDLFRKRLKGEITGVDHWSIGAWEALNQYHEKGIAMALAIQGHHIGLQSCNKPSLVKLDPNYLMKNHPLKLKLSEANISNLVSRFHADGLSMNSTDEFGSSIYQQGINNTSSMLDIRMLFSTLVDADFIETEAWFNSTDKGVRQYREPGLPLESVKALKRLLSYIRDVACNSDAARSVKEIRAELLQYCLESAKLPTGIFTLTAPTGSGKTLSMLAFALAHAVRNNLKHIIIVIPYLNIIEQTARVYRQLFAPYFSKNDLSRYILEHHSLSNVKSKVNPDSINDDTLKYLLAQNWDAPIVVTTNVQMLESLFSNGPFACRKLHHLANSIILFDEVQTLPLSLAVPTLGALSRLVERYHSSIVFSTATQPAFNSLDKYVRKQCANGWNPHEIVSNINDLFERSHRTQVILPEEGKALSWPDLADLMLKHDRALCIVNLKKHARIIFEELKKKDPRQVFHLSTNMCPAHRQAVLEKVDILLKGGKICRLVSTQCIEAGVDIDFPVVFRAMGPLDAIAQAAGRCNRNGHLPVGRVYVFNPFVDDHDPLFPDKAYRKAASVASVLVSSGSLDINDPELFKYYYRELYSVRGIGVENADNNPLINAIKIQDFVEVARNYRIIDHDAINVLVPYDRKEFIRLKLQALNIGLDQQWITEAHPYAVSLYRPSPSNNYLYDLLEPIKLKHKPDENSEEWFIYRKEEDYDSETGLNPSLLLNVNIA